MNSETPAAYSKNLSLEELLREVNDLLAPAEESATQGFAAPKYPPVFIVGNPRSGTTIALQWLAATGQFCYPTNLISRFYKAPLIGAKIQQILTDPSLNVNNEFFDLGHETTSFHSDMGKTRGALAPSEFFYLWHRFCPKNEIAPIPQDQESLFDGAGLARELAALESVFDKPLGLKGMFLQYNLPLLAKFFERAVYFFVKRDPLYNIQSILETRLKYHGTIDKWWSVKPAEYESLLDRSPFEQVAVQVESTNRAIERGIAQLPAEQCMTIQYEEFCRDPAAAYAELREKMAKMGCELSATYSGPASFETTNEIRLESADWDRLTDAYDAVKGRAF